MTGNMISSIFYLFTVMLSGNTPISKMLTVVGKNIVIIFTQTADGALYNDFPGQALAVAADGAAVAVFKLG